MKVSRRVFSLGLGALPALPAISETPVEPCSGNKAARKLFDDHEFAILDALAEIIVPGARQARVPEYLDLILADSPEQARVSFLEGLWWFDGYCRRSAAAPFLELTDAVKVRLVTEIYERESPAHAFLQSTKAWTARIYYSTEIGYQELNRGGRVPASYTGSCIGSST